MRLIACFLFAFLSGAVRSFVFNKTGVIPLENGDFTQYYDFFSVDRDNTKDYYITLSTYQQDIKNETTGYLYPNDKEPWSLRLFFVPNKNFLVEITEQNHFATFGSDGYKRLIVTKEKNVEKAFMIGNYLVFNKNGSTIDATQIENGVFSTVENVTELNIFELAKVHEVCFSELDEYCVENSTDTSKPIIVDSVPAVYHVNGLSLYYVGKQDENQYALKDHVTGKHYRFPIQLLTFNNTYDFPKTTPNFRIPILTNLDDPFFKKYR